MAKKSFYEVGSYTGDLQEGTDSFVRRQMRYLGENANFKPFLNTPIKELEQQLKESKAEEKKQGGEWMEWERAGEKDRSGGESK